MTHLNVRLHTEVGLLWEMSARDCTGPSCQILYWSSNEPLDYCVIPDTVMNLVKDQLGIGGLPLSDFEI